MVGIIGAGIAPGRDFFESISSLSSSCGTSNEEEEEEGRIILEA